MDRRIFCEGKMGLREEALKIVLKIVQKIVF